LLFFFFNTPDLHLHLCKYIPRLDCISQISPRMIFFFVYVDIH